MRIGVGMLLCRSSLLPLALTECLLPLLSDDVSMLLQRRLVEIDEGAKEEQQPIRTDASLIPMTVLNVIVE